MNQYGKRKLLLAVSMSVATQAMAAGNVSGGYGVTPSFIKTKESEAAPRTDVSLEAADSIRARNMAKALTENKTYQLDEVTIKGLSEAYAKNRGVEEAIRSINAQVSFAAKDSHIKNINELRLRIMSYLGSIDPYNVETVRNSATDAKASAGLDLATLVMTLSPTGLSAQAKENIVSFLTEVENAIKDGATLGDAMKVANDILVMSKGIEIDLTLIQAAARSSGGVVEIFKTEEDVAEVTVNGPKGVPLIVRMPLKKAKEVERLANEEAIMLMEMAKNPDVSKIFAEKGLKDLRSEVSEVNLFMKENRLLDRQSTFSKKTHSDSAKVADSVDELLEQLNEYGALVGGRGFRQNAARFLRKIPFVDKVIKDPATWKRTLREKILEIDAILADGVLALDANNQVLNNLKAEALKQMADLQISMAKTKLISDYLSHYANELEARGEKDTASVIRAEIGVRIESELNAAMSLYGVLLASVEGITNLVRTNHMIMTSGMNLRTIAAPAIAVTETIKEAASDARRVVAQNRATSKLLERQMEQMLESIQAVNKEFADHAGQSVISNAVLEKVLTGLAKEKVDQQKRMEEAFKKLQASDEKLIATLNKANQGLRQDALGSAMDEMILNSKNNKGK